jgi:hypothetical protein
MFHNDAYFIKLSAVVPPELYVSEHFKESAREHWALRQQRRPWMASSHTRLESSGTANVVYLCGGHQVLLEEMTLLPHFLVTTPYCVEFQLSDRF